MLCIILLLIVLENVSMVVYNEMQGSSIKHSLTVFSYKEFHMGRQETKQDI